MSGPYLIGQRVIVSGAEIATIIPTPKDHRDPCHNHVWVRLHNGVEQWRAKENVRPLPGGAL